VADKNPSRLNTSLKPTKKAHTTRAADAAPPRSARGTRSPHPPAKKVVPPIVIHDWATKHKSIKVEYATERGVSIVSKSEDVLSGRTGAALRGQVQLVFSSPPFPLNRKKKYGNLEGSNFKKWLRGYAKKLKELLTEDGSIVIEMGNAWVPQKPIMSTLAIETLLEFKRAAKLHLIQEFIWFNPARLPTPAQWVTVNRMRVKDAFTRLWWMSPTEYPKADNRRVLVPYSGSMKTLLKNQRYNSGTRPSEHVISPTSFLTDNGGAIPPNVLMLESEEETAPSNVLVGANTNGVDGYHKFCKSRGLKPHPARMPIGLAKFFINLCTEAGDLVLDPFGGSNTTGAAAEELMRRWITVEINEQYAAAGRGRFPHLVAQVPPIPDELKNAALPVTAEA